MRIMAVDYGDARTGLAVSDRNGILAGEAWTVNGWDPAAVSDVIAREAAASGVEKLVLGLPRNMDGSEGARAQKSRDFGRLLAEKTGLEVVMWDERLTTVDAHRILSDAGRHGKKRREKIDAVAATLILEGYLGSGR